MLASFVARLPRPAVLRLAQGARMVLTAGLLAACGDPKHPGQDVRLPDAVQDGLPAGEPLVRLGSVSPRTLVEVYTDLECRDCLEVWRRDAAAILDSVPRMPGVGLVIYDVSSIKGRWGNDAGRMAACAIPQRALPAALQAMGGSASKWVVDSTPFPLRYVVRNAMPDPIAWDTCLRSAPSRVGALVQNSARAKTLALTRLPVYRLVTGRRVTSLGGSVPFAVLTRHLTLHHDSAGVAPRSNGVPQRLAKPIVRRVPSGDTSSGAPTPFPGRPTPRAGRRSADGTSAATAGPRR